MKEGRVRWIIHGKNRDAQHETAPLVAGKYLEPGLPVTVGDDG